jgi:undecaprenyl-diphosphatase
VRVSWAKLSFPKVFGRVIEFFGWRLLLGLIAAFVSVISFLWLADEVFEGSTRYFDDRIRESIHQISGPVLTGLMLFITALGSAPVLVPLGICLAVVFFLLRWKRALALFAVTMAGELILEHVLKTIFQRVRPEAFFDYPLPPSYSFPSGHALASFCFYGILAWLITARLKNNILKFVIWALAVVLVFLIGTSRVYLGVHYPSDVIAGYLTALVWVMTVALGDFWFGRRKTPGTANEKNSSP